MSFYQCVWQPSPDISISKEIDLSNGKCVNLKKSVAKPTDLANSCINLSKIKLSNISLANQCIDLSNNQQISATVDPEKPGTVKSCSNISINVFQDLKTLTNDPKKKLDNIKAYNDVYNEVKNTCNNAITTPTPVVIYKDNIYDYNYCTYYQRYSEPQSLVPTDSNSLICKSEL